jgi:hypothetical protein
VGVTTYPMGRDLSYEELVERVSKTYEAGSSTRAIEEGSFRIPSAPGATTMRTIYETDVGRHFIWSASYRGNLTSVTVSIPPEASDISWARFEGEVMAKVYGPDRYVPDMSAAQ